MQKHMNVRSLLLGILLILAPFLAQAQTAPVYNVTSYGAKGDGKTIDSPSINKAIEAAARAGGGTVYFPAGKYASYSVRLQSNICLYLDQGAVLFAATPTAGAGYDIAEPNEFTKFQDFGHSHWKNSLIWGIGLNNVSILGPGMINGLNGLTRGENQREGMGNKAISLKQCRNVIIRDITLFMCGHFALLATGVDNMTIDNVKIDTNRDGLDIDCCRNVRISNCFVNSPWDDAIVLKASYGLGTFKDTEDVTITNCHVSGFDKGTMLDGTYQKKDPQAPDRGYVTGRIKMGTESSGGFKNITISNCVFDRCRGLALESVDGGSLENISISNITMRDIVNAPLFLRLGARMRSPAGTSMGAMRRINIDNIVCYNADPRFGCIISGVPGSYIEDVRISNVQIFYKGGGTTKDALRIPPESEKLYPEPWMFGITPSYGFFVRHARNVDFHNIDLRFMEQELRSPFYLMDVKGVRFNEVKAMKSAQAPTFVLKAVESFSTNQVQGVSDVSLGNTTERIL